MFTVLGLGVLLGVVGMSVSSTEGKRTEERKELEYDRDYCKEHLNRRYYDNWNCDTVADELRDNWTRQELNKLLENGYEFSRAVDKLVENGTIKL